MEKTSVWCDGGDEVAGHPKVYLNFSESTVCPYCSKNFISKKNGEYAKK